MGDVTLGSGVVPGLVCRDCHFDGDLIASGTTFQRTVDLSGSEVMGELRLVRGTAGSGHTRQRRDVQRHRQPAQRSGPAEM